MLASAEGGRIDLTIGLTHILVVALFVGWSIFFGYTLIRFRRSRNPVADPKGATGHTATKLEFAVAGAEIALLLGLSIPIWSQRVDSLPDPKSSTEIHVIAQQFAWNCHYPGADGLFGERDPGLIDAANPVGLDRAEAGADDIVTVNTLHVPVNKPVLIHLSSMDVIHSFYLPEMRIKQDSIPGTVVPVWFTPTVTTAEMRAARIAEGLPEGADPDYLNYEIACAQLCGLGHFRMKGFLYVDTPEEYDAWVQQELEFVESLEEEFYYEDEGTDSGEMEEEPVEESPEP